MPTRPARTLKPTTSPGPDSAPARTRTPPDVKWLLNERAALAGAVSKAVAKQQALCAKRERLEAQLEGVLMLLERSKTAQTRAQASIGAIDVTLGLAHPRVRPTYAGEVSAWAGKYGKRGGLGEYVEQALHAATPAALTTTVLINLASMQFGVTFPFPKDRRAFRKSVSSALTSLLKRGLIEPLHSREEGSHGLWRWKVQATTLEGLRARAVGMARGSEQGMAAVHGSPAGLAVREAT